MSTNGNGDRNEESPTSTPSSETTDQARQTTDVETNPGSKKAVKKAGGKSRRKKGGKRASPKGSKKGSAGKAAGAKRPRLFPAVTLEEALKIPYALKTKNGGNPWPPAMVAKAVDISPRRADFFYLANGSVSYGLTHGGWRAPNIELAPLGSAIVYAPNPSAEHAKKLEAFLSIDVFSKVLNHYKGSDLPEMKYLGNTLEKEFNLPPEHHEDFSRIFRANCEYLGIHSGFTVGAQDGSVPAGRTSQAITTVGPTSITLAEPAKETNLTAFVIMPFVERDSTHYDGFFQEVLRSLITPAARDAGFIVRTANRHGSDVIQSTIINDLLEADLVIADLTEHNPNVLFELGVRMGNDLPVCLIKASDTGQIFDVDNMLRVYPYSRNLWSTTIERDLPNLTDHIKGAWENRSSENTYMKILRRGFVPTSPTTFDAFPTTLPTKVK